jgi:galactonate dehydratase
LESLQPCLLADPCTPSDPQTLARIAADTSVPICAAPGGRRPGQLPFLQARAVGVLSIDPGSCGGLWESRQIAAAAEIHYTSVVARYDGVWAAPGSAWQLATIIPNLLFFEVPYSAISQTPFSGAFRIEDGHVSIPQMPGLGMDPDLEAIQRAGGVIRAC